jgi:hypothetical protein
LHPLRLLRLYYLWHPLRLLRLLRLYYLWRPLRL